jgi:hypothetical protein
LGKAQGLGNKFCNPLGGTHHISGANRLIGGHQHDRFELRIDGWSQL